MSIEGFRKAYCLVCRTGRVLYYRRNKPEMTTDPEKGAEMNYIGFCYSCGTKHYYN